MLYNYFSDDSRYFIHFSYRLLLFILCLSNVSNISHFQKMYVALKAWEEAVILITVVCNDHLQWCALIWGICAYFKHFDGEYETKCVKSITKLDNFFYKKNDIYIYIYIYMYICVCMFVPLCVSVAHICECEQDSDKFLTMAHIYSAE